MRKTRERPEIGSQCYQSQRLERQSSTRTRLGTPSSRSEVGGDSCQSHRLRGHPSTSTSIHTLFFKRTSPHPCCMTHLLRQLPLLFSHPNHRQIVTPRMPSPCHLFFLICNHLCRDLPHSPSPHRCKRSQSEQHTDTHEMNGSYVCMHVLSLRTEARKIRPT